MATVTASQSALTRPELGLPAIGLIADPLSQRRLESLLTGTGAIVGRAQQVDTLHGRVSAPLDVALLVGGAELLARGGPVARTRELFPDAAVVIVAQSDDRSLIRKALRAGVDGVVCEQRIDDALNPTICAVLAGQLSVPQAVRGRVVWRVFSLREKQVLELVARGLTNSEIAYQLFLSESTVKSHLSSCFRKLGVSSRAEAAAAVLDPDHGLSVAPAQPPLAAAPAVLAELERELLGAASA